MGIQMFFSVALCAVAYFNAVRVAEGKFALFADKALRSRNAQSYGDCYDQWVHGYGDEGLLDKGDGSVKVGNLVGVTDSAEECQKLCQKNRECFRFVWRSVAGEGLPQGNCLLKSAEMVTQAQQIALTVEDAESPSTDPRYDWCNLGLGWMCNGGGYNCLECDSIRCVYKSENHISGPKFCGRIDVMCDHEKESSDDETCYDNLVHGYDDQASLSADDSIAKYGKLVDGLVDSPMECKRACRADETCVRFLWRSVTVDKLRRGTCLLKTADMVKEAANIELQESDSQAPADDPRYEWCNLGLGYSCTEGGMRCIDCDGLRCVYESDNHVGGPRSCHDVEDECDHVYPTSTTPEPKCFEKWVYGWTDEGIEEFEGAGTRVPQLVESPEACQKLCQEDDSCVRFMWRNSSVRGIKKGLCVLKNADAINNALAIELHLDDARPLPSDPRHEWCNLGMAFPCIKGKANCLDCSGIRCVYESDEHITGPKFCEDYDRCDMIPINPDESTTTTKCTTSTRPRRPTDPTQETRPSN